MLQGVCTGCRHGAGLGDPRAEGGDPCMGWGVVPALLLSTGGGGRWAGAGSAPTGSRDPNFKSHGLPPCRATRHWVPTSLTALGSRL